ncbi:D-glucuronyl C5-epimerase-like [Haliotis rufescens]|uniref:D-glucuronyl C5-epimerase-like n=1 Tax=Haliotis rufescens TaxID=6454 RepID=UPI001EB08842|nr:D-glucuronyl C5-epimerase-like [Haliotis rufescens]XP_046376712.1 D-glucuronyl C5-epimerase-like [Haliotis rufescens]XP_046376714.1 D-glucuronyl C5-epimerase-like [Haliotis rufescens]XP_046376715.1 D-glucuronyl C5-epimerase-like [Haliotis rufescens]XP_046376716.1 D-glucuronyl C5-epimerase-like [Haliotis rufescens]XP_046376717.1 D-glucuronyl C5-epimerase-like [Haliotis rufescens]XP_046376718.1 D-glucuronyl C5-epimerase-like [Haliotis rufescens]XP_046376719.1 D-glucuronyl C5-epimerase-like 
MRRSRIIKFFAALVVSSAFLSVCLWSQCTINRQDNNFYREDVTGERSYDDHMNVPRGTNSIKNKDTPLIKYKEIDCVINDDYAVKCRREGSEVYVPFRFIQDYFEIYGSIVNTDGYDRLEWQHSNSKIHKPRPKYSPSGIFMSFEYYNVEQRDRVKCISGFEGVPVSTQWTPEGHYYPIQIAQYGLSHHSKYMMDGEPDVIILEDGEEDSPADWIVPEQRSFAVLKNDASKFSHVVQFLTSDSTKLPGIRIVADEKVNKYVTADLKFSTNGSLTVSVETLSTVVFNLHYVLSNTLIICEGKDIYYGLGDTRGRWHHIARDISIDLQKGLGLKYSKTKRIKMKYQFSKIREITIRGHGHLDNLTLSSSAHLEHFYDAANWLVSHQNDRGGWPIAVRRKLIPNLLELPPGWYSAMAQGQAMSLLVRAYWKTKAQKYLIAAIDAMKLFEISSEQGGVLAKFAGEYDWYEEYPTTPSSFVLNGFIYSLLGLYDLKETASGEAADMANNLYKRGLTSLKFMLGMFDTGSGTFYDLRHITLGLAPNRARWDYHTTHINQLLELSVIERDPLFKTTANRWTDYMKGKRAKHN